MSSTTSILVSKLVQAGAGAGKTTALSEHVYESLISFYQKNGYYPHFVVCTFTVKATQELKERLLQYAFKKNNHLLFQIIKDPSYLTISTIHGLLNGFLRKYAIDFGLQPDFQLQDELLEVRFRKKVLRELLLQNASWQAVLEYFSFQELNSIVYNLFVEKLSNPNLKALHPEAIESLLQNEFEKIEIKKKEVLSYINGMEALKEFASYLYDLKSDLSNLSIIDEVAFPRRSKKIHLDDAQWEQVKSFRDLLKEMSGKAYIDQGFWSSQNEIVSAIDQLSKAFYDRMIHRKIKESKICLSEIEGLAKYLFDRYPQVIEKIKEDIDFWYVDEFQDTSPLQMEILEKLIQEKPKYIVGDPQQSIYFFRGADVSLFDDVKKSFLASGKEVEVKNINYRSTDSMLNVINDIFTPFGFVEMQPHHKANDQHAAEVILQEEDSEHHEIIAIIHSLVRHGATLKDIAVLTKTNDELKQMQSLLVTNQIPVLVSASGGLFDNIFVKDLLYYLICLANPYNNEVLFTVLKNPIWKLEDKEIQNVFTHKETSAWKYIIETNLDSIAIRTIKKSIELLKTESYSQVLQKFLIEFELLDVSLSVDPSGLSYANIIKLQQILKEKEGGLDFNIIRFVKYCLGYYIPFDEPEAISPALENQLQLMTVHKAKGLQFKYVILPFMHKAYRDQRSKILSVDPISSLWSVAFAYGEENTRQVSILGKLVKEREDQIKRDENKRLFYVAVTRAIEKVFFVGSQTVGNDSWFSLLPLAYMQNKKYSGKTYYCTQSEYPKQSHVPIKKTHQQRGMLKANDILQPSKRFSVTQILSDNSFSARKKEAKELLLAEYLGTKTHSLLERWRYHKEPSTEALDYLLSQTEFPFADLMNVAEVEWGFSYKVNEYLMEGKIDLWGVIENEVWIVDYKTGSPRYKDKAFSQLQYYSLPVRAFTGISKVNLVVTYPFAKTTYKIEALDERAVYQNLLGDVKMWSTKNESLIQDL